MTTSRATTSVFLGILSLLSAGTTEAVESARGCSSGLLGVDASIYRIEPADLPVNVQSAMGTQAEERKAGDCLRAGEILTLQNKAQKVVLFTKGDFKPITADPPQNGVYEAPKGISFSDKAAAWVNMLKELKSITSTPIRESTGTSTPRGEADRDNNLAPMPRQPLQNIKTLRHLPWQQISSNATVLLSWRGGESPWKCAGLGQDGAAVTEAQSVSGNWCVLSIIQRPPMRLSVKDARGDKIGWNVATVSPAAVPRPEWIAQPETGLSSADRTAWAIWVWKSAGSQWRLQALSMLNENSKSSWLAGYVLNSILNDAPIVRVNDADVRQ